MATSKQLYDQIANATTRLAQRKAREMLLAQREATRNRQTARREEMRRRAQLGALVFAAGCEHLADGEIVSALLIYGEGHSSAEGRQQAKTRGDAHLAALEAGVVARKH